MSGSTFRTTTGKTVRLGAILGRGGEGTVHAVEGDADLAAKVYLPGLAAERRDKVVAMVDAGWHTSASFVAFPIDCLLDPRSGNFAGFTMRKVGGHKPVHQLYSPTGRKTAFPAATYPLLVRAVSNVARAMASVHATGCVVGDVNHSGVLVAPDATVTLIDADSFQVSHANRHYPCKVGVPEFTPPELQGQPLDKVHRTANHDAFGLAVLVFYTLIMGRHPFAGRYNGPGDMPMDRAIREFRFAYSARRAATLMDPPPNVPTLTDLPLPLADALERAFGPAGVGQAGRPTAAEWVGLIDRAEADLVRCAQSSAHHHFRSGPGCPWCRMEQAYPGFLAFVPAIPPNLGTGGKPLDLGQLIAAVRGVPDPGPAPDLASLMPAVPEPPPSPGAAEARRARMTRWALGGVGALVGLTLLLVIGGGASLFGLLALGGSGVLALNAPVAFANLQGSAQRARTAWRDAQERFRQAAGNEHFRRVRQDAEALLQQLQGLAGEEARRLAELDAKRRDGQMRRHLERFLIDHVKIKGIGNARKLTLKSYGIETAADVARHRIEAIHGFGPSTATALLAWRYTVESKFVFDPRQPVSAQDVAAVKADVAKRRSDAEGRLNQTLALLQKAERDAKALRANPGPDATQAWVALKQAEVDAKALETTGADFGRFVGLGVGALVLLALISQFGRGRPAGEAVTARPSVVALPAPQPPVTMPGNVSGQPSPPAASFPEAQRPIPSGSVVNSAPGAVVVPPAALDAPRPPEPAPISAPTATAPLLTASEAGTLVPPPVAVNTRSAGFPQEPLPQPFTGTSGGEPSLGPVPPLNLLSRGDGARVQHRLATLGYLNGLVDGIWGPRSRAALKEFRRTNGLGVDDRWDEQTQATLLSDRALRSGSTPMPLIATGSAADAAYPPPPGATRNPLNRSDALWLQTRLRTLGFYSLDGEGVWGQASRDALRDFKAVNGLTVDDTWDEATERALGGPLPVRAEQTFVGRFAASPSECAAGTAGQPPVTIGARRAEAFGGICEFDDVQRERENIPIWLAKGRCSVNGSTWPVRIRLSVASNKLIWSSERGVTVYHRCQ